MQTVAIEVDAQLRPCPVRRRRGGQRWAVDFVHRREHADKGGQRRIGMAGDIDELGIGKALQQRVDAAAAQDILGEVGFVRAGSVQKALDAVFVKIHHLCPDGRGTGVKQTMLRHLIQKGKEQKDARTHEGEHKEIFILFGGRKAHGVDVIPAAKKALVKLAEQTPERLPHALIPPMDGPDELVKTDRREEGVQQAHVGVVGAVQPQQALQIGGAAARVGNHKDRRLDGDLFVGRVNEFVNQPQREEDGLVQKIEGHQAHHHEPQAKIPRAQREP